MEFAGTVPFFSPAILELQIHSCPVMFSRSSPQWVAGGIFCLTTCVLISCNLSLAIPIALPFSFLALHSKCQNNNECRVCYNNNGAKNIFVTATHRQNAWHVATRYNNICLIHFGFFFLFIYDSLCPYEMGCHGNYSLFFQQ